MAKEPNKSKTTTGKTPRAGSRTIERRKEREKERRRRQVITGGIIVAALIAAVIFVALVVTAPADATIPNGALTRFDGITQSVTKEGYPRLGDPNTPVQVADYSSFDCPHCADFHDQVFGEIVQRVKENKIAFTYVPLYDRGAIANGQGAALAAMCYAEQDKFWPFQDALFYWQKQYGNQAFTNNRLQAAIKAFNVNASAYSACMGSSRPGDILSTAKTQASALLNFKGTPTITINGVVPLDDKQQPLTNYNDILARIDEEVARLGPLPPTATPKSAATQEATPEVTATTESTAETTQAAALEAAATTAATQAATQESTPEVTATAEATAGS